MEEVPEESVGEEKCTWKRGICLIKKRFNNMQDLVTLSGGLYFKEWIENNERYAGLEWKGQQCNPLQYSIDKFTNQY